jgi:hypothetical protein
MIRRSATIATLALTACLLGPDLQKAPSKADQFRMELRLCAEAQAAGAPDKCRLYGKIQLVDHFPDVKVQVVDHFPDLKVKVVDHFPDSPGKWKMVDHFPDFKVQVVDHFPDIKIKYVDHFPGCN